MLFHSSLGEVFHSVRLSDWRLRRLWRTSGGDRLQLHPVLSAALTAPGGARFLPFDRWLLQQETLRLGTLPRAMEVRSCLDYFLGLLIKIGSFARFFFYFKIDVNDSTVTVLFLSISRFLVQYLCQVESQDKGTCTTIRKIY